jgi:prevent-host-death family protein
MSKYTFSSRELNQALNQVKKSALSGPVIITDRGRPAHVMMSYAEYQRLTGKPVSIVQRLSSPSADDVDFEPEKISVGIKPAELD